MLEIVENVVQILSKKNYLINVMKLKLSSQNNHLKFNISAQYTRKIQ